MDKSGREMNNYHVSVLLRETVDLLTVQKGKKYIDATLGGGGHSTEILRRGGKVLGLDVDQDALDYVEEKCKTHVPYTVGEDFILVRGNFRNIDTIAKDNGFDKVAGVVFDLGVSSHQFEIAERGFSFQKEGPLDMRMDKGLKVKASDLINILTKGELYELFTKLGEERFARAIADGIVRARGVKPIQTTRELAEIVSKAMPKRHAEIHPATRIFQALRIAVNDELNNLREALSKACSLLDNNGRVCVISFHSLEDRIVKYAFRDFAAEGLGEIITKKPVIPSEEEQEMNRRSRSAKLRVFERKN